MCLWDHADKYLLAYPSHPTIARETGFAERTTKDATAVLWRRGFIRRQDGLLPGDELPRDRRAVRWLVEPTPDSVDRPLVRQVH